MSTKSVTALRRFLSCPLLLCLGFASAGAQTSAAPSPQPIVATINAGQVKRPVSRYEYGMFIEHIGPLVYRSLWSEMLNDRKFYYPIQVKKPGAAPPPSRGPGFFRMRMPKWRPAGPAAGVTPFVTMDPHDPFVGEHSPRVALDGSTPRGIRQSGLALVKGKRYTGHIYLRAARGARVHISLIWGAGAGDRQTISIPSVPATYRRYPFHFTAGASTANATLEITGTGSGDFHIGTLSLMPADNIDGFRPHVIALLRSLHSGFWRLPGGNFIADFNWYDSVGPRDQRPPVMDYAWHAVQSNDVGMDEFMTFCRLIGVAPYITVNAQFGDAHSAMQEVQYINGPVSTPMGAWRARNGHPAPYHVKFWDIGNEPYGTWELGRTDLKYYLIKHRIFAQAMRQADPSITLLASAAMPEEMIIEGIAHSMHIPDEKVNICTPDVDWTCAFLKDDWGTFSGITEHWYSRPGLRFDIKRADEGIRYQGHEAGYVPYHPTVMQWVRTPSNRVHLKAEEWEAYEKLFPKMTKKKIFLSNDEYAYGRSPNLKLALAYAMVFDEMLRHSSFWRMSAFTMGVSTLNLSPTASSLNTNGLLFKFYGEHMGGGEIPVAVSGNSPQPAPTQHLVGDLPRTSAGSPTYPLDMVAVLSPDHTFLTVAVVNATSSAQPLTLHIDGVHITGGGTLWTMTGPDLNAANLLGKAPQVTISQSAVGNASQPVSVAPISINMYRFPVAAQ